MPVDLGIYQNLLRPPKSALEYGAEMDAADMQRQQAELGKMNLLQQQQAMQDDRALRGLYADPNFKPDSPEGLSRVFATAGPKAGYALQKSVLDNKKTAGEITKNAAEGEYKLAQAEQEKLKTVIEKQAQIAQAAAAATDQASWDRGIQVAAALGADVSNVPRIFDPKVAQQLAQQAMTSKDQAELRWKAKEYDLSLRKQGEIERHNKTEEGTSGGNLNVARKNASLREQELDFNRNQPKGVITQTDQGPVLVDPRTGQAQPLTMGGEKLGPKLAQVPASANTALITNKQNLSKIQQAIDLIDGKDVGALKGDENATGVKGYLPNGLLNRVDPNGVDARAMIADIGSLIIHDRSGAAVTAAESPRLMPFIPLATDDKETVRKKLVRFKQLYEQESKGLEQAYSRDAGYNTKPPKAEGGLSPEEQAELDALRKRFKK